MSLVKRKPAAARQLEISSAALTLVGREGERGLTAAAIAAEVGLTSGALFRHFPSIDAILDAAAQQAIALVEGSFPSAELPPLERLEGLIRARVALLRGRPGLVWMLLSEQASARLPVAARERLAGCAAATRAYLTTALEEARSAGQLTADVPLAAQLTILIGAVHALARGARPSSDAEVDTILDGIFQLLGPTER